MTSFTLFTLFPADSVPSG